MIRMKKQSKQACCTDENLGQVPQTLKWLVGVEGGERGRPGKAVTPQGVAALNHSFASGVSSSAPTALIQSVVANIVHTL